jgi:hypothetical protein
MIKSKNSNFSEAMFRKPSLWHVYKISSRTVKVECQNKISVIWYGIVISNNNNNNSNNTNNTNNNIDWLNPMKFVQQKHWHKPNTCKKTYNHQWNW